MSEQQRRDLLLDVMNDFAVIGEVHKHVAAKLESAGLPEAQNLLLLHSVRTAERAIQKASVILLGWAIGSSDPAPAEAESERPRH